MECSFLIYLIIFENEQYYQGSFHTYALSIYIRFAICICCVSVLTSVCMKMMLRIHTYFWCFWLAMLTGPQSVNTAFIRRVF